MRFALVPVDGARQAFFHRRPGAEAEFVGRAGYVELAPGLTVGLRRIPDDLAAEPDPGGDCPCQIADGDLLAGTEIHRLPLVVLLRGDDDALGGILDIEKLARRRSIAPQRDR